MTATTVTLNRSHEREPGTVTWDTGVELPIEADIPFDSTLAGASWYPSEIFEGVCFRWMGGSRTARVIAVLDRSIELELSVYVPHIVDHACWDKVTFRVDGHPVLATLAFDDVHRYVARLPARPASPTPENGAGADGHHEAECFTEIEICAPFAKQPNPNDARTLSIGVSLVRVRPITPEVLARNGLVVRAALLSYFAERHVAGLLPVSNGPGGGS